MILAVVVAWASPAWAANPLTNLQLNAVADGNGNPIDVTNQGSVGVVVKGTFAATLNFEGSVDNGVTWTSVLCTTLGTTTSGTATSTTGQFQCNVGGLAQFRARVSGFASGSVTAVASSSVSGGGGGSGGSISGTIALDQTTPGTTNGVWLNNLIFGENSAPTCSIPTAGRCSYLISLERSGHHHLERDQRYANHL
jgi:hypothetical protein